MSCDCIEMYHSSASTRTGLELNVAISLDGKPHYRVVLATNPVENSNGEMLLANYCPFCGQKYED